MITGRRRTEPAQVLRRAAEKSTPPHVHWFRWAGENPYANGSLYRCRCGVVRSGL